MTVENIVEKDSIQDFNNTITLFYGEKTGIIRDHAQGRQDLSYYKENAGDFNYNFIVIEKDDYILNNLEKFLIQDGQLVRKPDPEASKYPIAK